MLRFVKLSILLLIILNVSLLNAQEDSTKCYLKGVVTTEHNLNPEDLEVSLKNSLTDVSYVSYTNNNGRFSFELDEGEYEIQIAYEGYAPYDEKGIVLKNSETRNIYVLLVERLYTIEEIEVEGFKRQRQDDLRTSLFDIAPKSVKILPGSVEDVMRSLQSLPGVSSPNDFTSQLIIRGSGPDQNLIIMDDVEIFNPYRLYGLVSMFNPETLSDITLITGGFPSQYGDRLSAVLDVMNREGTRDKYISMISNINIASANIIFQGKNPFEIPGSWIVSTRRTYYDLILGPFAKSAGLITDDSSFPSFSDLQFKLAVGPFEKHKFFLNGIFSKDGVDIISGKDRDDPDSVNVDDATINNVVSLSWHYIPSQNFISRTTASWYKNGGVNEFEGDILDPLIDKENLSPAQRDSLKAIGALLGFEFDSDYIFRKYSIGNRSIFLAGKNKYEFGGGFDIISTDLKYTLKLDEQMKSFIQSIPTAHALLDDFNIEGDNNYRANLYGQGRFSIGDKFYYQPSVRLDYYSFLKKVYVSPRINFGYIIDPLTTIRAAYGFYYQSPGYEKLVDSRTFFDLTQEIGENLAAERSIHYVIGLERWLDNEWLAKVEGYYKSFNNLIYQEKLTGYKYEFTIADPNNTNPSYIKNPHNWIRSQEKLPYDSLTTIPVNEGTGYSYGLELSLEKRYVGPKTKLYGWINYSLSNARRERDGISTPFKFDQRHVLNVVMNYRINSWLELGARWTYASNFPITEPVGIIPRVVDDSIVVNPITNQVIFNLNYGGEENIYSSKKPDYHRIDIRLTAYTHFWNTDWSFYVDVMNVLNRKNVVAYDYYLTNDLKLEKKTVGMIPLLPTIGISARF
ncbi:MAG: TonB-dependent receptor [Ignavibacteria bacterium]|nr:TonB-dependent receptor [Ignavibacteria bacterium]